MGNGRENMHTDAAHMPNLDHLTGDLDAPII